MDKLGVPPTFCQNIGGQVRFPLKSLFFVFFFLVLLFLVGTDRPIGEKRSALYRTADAMEIAVLGAEGWIASLSVNR